MPPSAALGTVKVMYRVIAAARIATDPSVAPVASMNRWPKPCTSISRFHAEPGAMA